jgi:hypothetical protein
MASLLVTFLIGCLLGFSLILLSISLVSFRRTKNSKLLLVSIAFLIFLVKAILLITWLVLTSSLAESNELMVMLVLDLVILLFLYFAIAKR